MTGPGLGEGKTTTTVNTRCPRTGRQTGRGGGVRPPGSRGLHRFFRHGNEIGVSSVLAGRADLKDALQPTGVDGIWIIAQAVRSAAVRRRLSSSSPRSEAMLDQLSTRFDFVLLDAGRLGGGGCGGDRASHRRHDRGRRARPRPRGPRWSTCMAPAQAGRRSHHRGRAEQPRPAKRETVPRVLPPVLRQRAIPGASERRSGQARRHPRLRRSRPSTRPQKGTDREMWWSVRPVTTPGPDSCLKPPM